MLMIWAAIPARADMPIFYAVDGLAVAGYDVVTYFSEGAPRRGSPDHAVMWKGAVWRFVSEQNREAFELNPRAYAPQFGGYCAHGVSRGQLVRTDPEIWQISDGKLYLIHAAAIWAMWKQDIKGNIALANANWPQVLVARN